MFSRLEWSWSKCVTTQSLRVHPKLTHVSTSFWHKAFTGTVPFSYYTSPTAMMAIIDGRRPYRPTHPALTDRLWELMNRCWDQDRHNRPRMLEVLLALNPPIHECTRPNGPLSITADAQTIVSDIQQRLGIMDPSNEEYRPLVCALLGHRDLKSHVDSLQNGDLQGFIELLDEVGKANTDPTVLTSPTRRSTTFQSQTISSEKPYGDCREHVATVRSFRGLIPSRENFRIEWCRLRPGVLLTRTKRNSMGKRSASSLWDPAFKTRFVHWSFVSGNCVCNTDAHRHFMKELSRGRGYGTPTSSIFMESPPRYRHSRSFTIGWNMMG